jgi:hypothetical protein
METLSPREQGITGWSAFAPGMVLIAFLITPVVIMATLANPPPREEFTSEEAQTFVDSAELSPRLSSSMPCQGYHVSTRTLAAYSSVRDDSLFTCFRAARPVGWGRQRSRVPP